MVYDEEMSQFPEEVLLPIPTPLKTLLEDDCFWILRGGKLLQLPAELTVERILREYYFNCLENATEDTNFQLLSEVLDGVKIFFDFTLLDHLLYAPEKEQHKLLGVINPVFTKKTTNNTSASLTHACEASMGVAGHEHMTHGLVPSQVYGPIHLLRLFVKLPQFLACTQLPPNHIHILQTHCRDFLGYMCSRRQDIFSGNHYHILPTHSSNNMDSSACANEPVADDISPS